MEINTEQVLLDLSKSLETISKTQEQYPLVIADLVEVLKANTAALTKGDVEAEKKKNEKDEDDYLASKVEKAVTAALAKAFPAQGIEQKVAPKEEAPKAKQDILTPSGTEKVEKAMEVPAEAPATKKVEDEKARPMTAADLEKAMETMKKGLISEFGWVKNGFYPKPRMAELGNSSETIMKGNELTYDQYVAEATKLGYRQLAELEEKVLSGEITITNMPGK